jgi:BMFP domain-containing protein YqiC
MDTRTAEQIKSWERRPVDDAFGTAADPGFSGVLRAGPTYLFAVGGRPVGVFDYRENPSGDPTVTPVSVEDAAGATESFLAPHDALPLLFAMQAAGGETRGRYYSNDTPLAEVDRTLQDGGFTGYVELSENVLSGDYYLVYHGGRRRAVAFVGPSQRLKTDDEAFGLAADETGIYTVERGALRSLSFPDSVTGGGMRAGGAAGAGAGAAAGSAAEESTDATPTDPTPEEPADPPSEATEPATESASSSAVDTIDIDITPHGVDREPEAEADATTGADTDVDGDAVSPDDTVVMGESEASEAPDTSEMAPEPTDDTPESLSGAKPSDSIPAIVPVSESDTEPQADTTSEPAGDTAVPDDHAVPSVDPDRSGRDTGTNGSGVVDEGVPSEELPAGAMVDGETRAGLREELAERDAMLEEREAELDRLRERLAGADAREAELEARIEELESRLEAAGAAPEGAERSLSPDEALAGTSLFVRYRSKRDPTLEDVPNGAEPDTVAENLRLEHHTTFDASVVAVDGRAFDAFLGSTQAHAFVRWLVEDLPYEIRDTGTADSLAPLYAALPALDRLEFDGEVETDAGTMSFDVVGRDRMGQPLVVANLQDVRDPTDETALGTLVTDATAVAESHDSLAGSFEVTSAYFEPAALGTASEATSGSLLSRSKRKSFVKLSRNQGFHLALVEDREESFYLSVPKL